MVGSLYMYMYMYIDPTDSRTMTTYHAHYQGHQDSHQSMLVHVGIHTSKAIDSPVSHLKYNTYMYMYMYVHTHMYVCMVPIFFLYQATDLPWSTGMTVISYLSMGESAGVGATFHTSITE